LQPAAATAAPSTTIAGGAAVDFDVHGVAGIRVVGAGPRELAAVTRQIGPFQARLHRAPAITIRFVDHLPIDGLRFVEYGRTGFTEDGFFVLQHGKQPVRVQLAIDEANHRIHYTCERGLHAVPLLLAMLNLVVLDAGYVPLHASAFVHEGTGVVVTGWAKGGKTEALLAFAAHGAEYIGDEWILLARDGRAMLGVPEHIRLQDWHLRQVPDAARAVRHTRKAWFTSVRSLERAHRVITAHAAGRVVPLGWLTAALPALRRQLNVQLDPARLFSPGPHRYAATPRVVCLMTSHADPDIRIVRCDVAEIAARMSASVAYEQSPLMSTYLAYRFAFPHRSSAWIERAPLLQAEMLGEALAGLDGYEVRHPYPCDLGALYERMAAACGARVIAPQHGAAVGPVQEVGDVYPT
jgi:hypothetical protein